MGFRTKYGLKKNVFKNLIGIEFENSFNEKLLQNMKNEKLLIMEGNTVRLGSEALLLHNEICRRLLSAKNF